MLSMLGALSTVATVMLSVRIVKGAHVPLRKRWHLPTAQAMARPSRSAEAERLRSDLARVRQPTCTVRHGSSGPVRCSR
jgi:hypothetical protein